MLRYLVYLTLILLLSCKGNNDKNRLFTLLSSDITNIDFRNDLSFDEEFNIYTYRNFYNGGGVGLGDFNNDGLTDVYFTSNMSKNRLFINKGKLSFEDFTDSSGSGGKRAWSTGVSIVDINADGWLDIYVCNSGDVEGDNKQNELFINNGDLTFSERAEAYGLADKGYSTHAAFFDYDRDGDLDMYLLNNSYQAIGSFNLKVNARNTRDLVGGDKLFRNESGRFVDVSEEASIYGSIIGFGLGVTTGDVNRDGWIDIYVSNDFFERDYLYINNQDGTFTERLTEQIRSISGASMGADMADINNDGYPDIFVTEMLPEEESRIKTKTTFENWDKYQNNVENGYYHQFTRNMFHLNNGNSTFSEIGRLSNVHATDWSWGALIADFNNDGNKEIFVANGIFQDLTDQDFLNYIANEETIKEIINDEGVDYAKLIEAIPSNKLSNYMFSSQSDSTNIVFEDRAAEWDLDQPSFSNGAAYGDLDNDGDLDLIVNNVNMEAFVYRNNSESYYEENANNYIKIILKGSESNSFALGSNVVLKGGNKSWFQEHLPTRGFQSSVDYSMLVGLGDLQVLDSIVVTWPDGQVTVLQDIPVNQSIQIQYGDERLNEPVEQGEVDTGMLAEVDASQYIKFTHTENIFVDFDRDRLLFHMKSTEGPCFCQGDVNKDGLEDIYIGGAKDQPGALLIQSEDGVFKSSSSGVFTIDRVSEDIDCVLFDADGDLDLDLYVASGGNEFPLSSSALSDRLYINNGKATFEKSAQILPNSKFESSSTVDMGDFDNDGDLDLLVGIRLIPFKFGVPANLYVLENDGLGNFKNISSRLSESFNQLGLITDAHWVDIDQNGHLDIIVVGEWMSPRVFLNEGGRFVDYSEKMKLSDYKGWWKTIEITDLNQDGRPDFVLGNTGLNSRFKADINNPISVYINDFDQNGQAEHIFTMYNDGQSYPIALKHDLITQIPGLKKEYLQYSNFAGKHIEEIFTEEMLSSSIVLIANTLVSVVLINNGVDPWKMIELPIEAQISPIYAINSLDINGDNDLDLIVGGNLHNVKPEIGRYDASYGHVLIGNGHGEFRVSKNSGMVLKGEVRAIEKVTIGRNDYIITIRNNDRPQLFEIVR